MRTWNVGLNVFLACNALATVAAAQPWRDEHREPDGARVRPDPLMTALDADKDGIISAGEIGEAAAALRSLDRDGDGRLTRPETAAVVVPSGRHERDRAVSPSLIQPPQPKSELEQRVLGVLDDLDRRDRRRMNVSVADGRLLRLLTAAIGAKHAVELGTYNGYSALWMCLGLKATGGRLTTYEIDEGFAAEARRNLERAGVEDIVTVVVGDAHHETKALTEPIDLLFIDADKQGYVYYLRRLLPLVRPGGLIIAHNMIRPPPDPRYVEAVTTNPDLETVFLLMDGAGVGVTMKKR
jgi:predicted O-methyltransferase YrrM